jgi:hypothetical protein
VIQHVHKVHRIKSKSILLKGTPTETPEMIENCATQTLQDCGLLMKYVTSSGDNMKSDFAEIYRSGSKNVFHASN